MMWLTRCERHHAQPGKGHQCVVEPVSDSCPNTGDQPCKDVLDRQARRHVWRVDWRDKKENEGGQGERIKTVDLMEIDDQIKEFREDQTYWNANNLLGVNANLCLHNSQYSFLLCLSHCSKLGNEKTPHEFTVFILWKVYIICTLFRSLLFYRLTFKLTSFLHDSSQPKLLQTLSFFNFTQNSFCPWWNTP